MATRKSQNVRDLNQMRLRGHLGDDAQVISGDKGVRLRLATNRFYRSQDDQGNETTTKETTWHSVTCWGERGMRYKGLKKGDHVETFGRLEKRNAPRQSDGVEVEFTNVIVNEVALLAPALSSSSADPQADGDVPPPPEDE